jgi:hypothetical protein
MKGWTVARVHFKAEFYMILDSIILYTVTWTYSYPCHPRRHRLARPNITLELTGEYDDSWLTILGYLAAPPKTAREYAYLRLSHKKVSKVKSPQPPVSPDLHLPFLCLKDRFPTNV